VEPGPGGEAELLGLLLAHHEHGGGAVGDLRRVAGGDLAVGLERRLQVGERLDGGAGADALVLGDELGALDDVAGLLVEALLGDPDDLVVEAALLGGPLGPLLGLGPEGVELLAGQAPLVGDHLGRDPLRDEAGVGVAGEHPVAEGDRAGGHRGPHGGGGHDLDAGGDGDVVGTGDHALGGEVGRLLGRAALAIDRGGRHGLGEPGRQHGVAADVEALVPDLHDAAHDHVVDALGVELVALDELLQDLTGEVGGVPPRQLSVALAAGGADGVDDDGGGHGFAPQGSLDRTVKCGRGRHRSQPGPLGHNGGPRHTR
jgi:hypothetical protein